LCSTKTKNKSFYQHQQANEKEYELKLYNEKQLIS